MQPEGIPGFHYLTVPAYNCVRLTDPVHYGELPPQMPAVGLQSSNLVSHCSSNDRLSVISEKKRRRMISNRESARRSRMRKQRHLDQLRVQVVWLTHENNMVIEKLKRMSEAHESSVEENSKLNQEICELKQMIKDLQVNNSYHGLRELVVIPCDEYLEI